MKTETKGYIEKKIAKVCEIAEALSGVAFDLQEVIGESNLVPMKDALYMDNHEESPTKIAEWSEFWGIFFGHYEDECLPVMQELRDALDHNIETIKRDNKYHPISIGGVYKD